MSYKNYNQKICPCDKVEKPITHQDNYQNKCQAKCHKVKCHKELDLCPGPVCTPVRPANPCNFSNPPTRQEWINYLEYIQSDEQCDPACSEINFEYDFRMAYNPADFDLVFGTDGVVTDDATGLTVNSVPFTVTIPLGIEHAKWLRYYNEVFPLCDTHEVIFEAEIAAQQVIPSDSIPTDIIPRIRDIRDDIRIASAAFNLIDLNTWMVFDFFLSDTAIYAVYERLPNGKPALGNYAAFSSAIWVARRAGVDPLNEFVKLAIGIHKGLGIVTWYVNDIPVFSINTIGYRTHEEYRLIDYGGEEELVDVESVRVGFGTFSLLDAALPNNYARNYVTDVLPLSPATRDISSSALVQLDLTNTYRELFPNPITGLERPLVDPSVTFAYVLNETPDDNREVKLFGQGAILKIRVLRVYSKEDNVPLEVSTVNH